MPVGAIAVMNSSGDPAKFAAATDWKPEIPFTQTLSDLLDYYRGL